MKNKIERRFNSTFTQAKAGEQSDTDLRLQRNSDKEAPQIVGYTAVFGKETNIGTFFGDYREKIAEGAFARAIKEKHDVRALRNHDPDKLLGRTRSKTLRMREDERGLFVEIDPPDNSVGVDTVESIQRGDLSGMSFAFVVTREKWVRGKREENELDLRIIEDVDLFDVGPVTYPAYEETTADLRSRSEVYAEGMRSMGVEMNQEQRDALREQLGVDISTDMKNYRIYEDEKLVEEGRSEDEKIEEKSPEAEAAPAEAAEAPAEEAPSGEDAGKEDKPADSSGDEKEAKSQVDRLKLLRARNQNFSA